MSKLVHVQKFTKEAIDAANRVPKEEIKRVKHMTKPELVAYYQSVWQSGYDVGRQVGLNEAQAAFNAKGVSEHSDAENAVSGQE